MKGPAIPRLAPLFALAALLMTHGVDALAADANAPAKGDIIKEIRVEQNKRVEREAVIRALKNKEGTPFNRDKTADDLKALWALNYFADIQLLVQHLPKGGVSYIVRVTEKPAVREVKLEGNEELSKDDFKEAIDIKANSILDLDAVRRNVKKIQDKYVDKGYFLAEVSHRLDPIPDVNQVDVVFVIKEHAKVMVKQISFLGAEKVPAADIKDSIQTKEGGYLSFITSDGVYKEEQFQRDLTYIQGLYYDRGFINVKVDKPWVSISADKKYIYITIKIDEGEQFRIGSMDFSGDLLGPKNDLRVRMGSHPGEIFNRTKLSKDILALTDVYYDVGYAYANVTPVTAVHAENKTIDLTFDVQKGKQVYIEKIEVSGNTKTRDQVIRREARIYEGELFSGTGLRRTKERVTALGFFETVEVTHKPGSDDTRVIVTIEVKEKATGTFQVGLGFSNVENFVFTAQVAQQNFLGWGQSVSLSAQLSSLRSYFQLSYFDPYFLDSQYILSSDLYRTQLDYFGFIRSSWGGDINVGRHLWGPLEDMMVNLTYTLETVTIQAGSLFSAVGSEIPLANAPRSGIISAMRGSATWDRRDNRLFPSKGFMLFGSYEVSPPQLGASFEFTRLNAYGRYYQPLPFGFVLKGNANVGMIQNLNPNQPPPLSELYKLGGINTIRGYYLRSIGPTTLVPQSTDPSAPAVAFGTGGNKQVYFNLELEFPIFEKVGIRGVLFSDAGNVYSDGSYNTPVESFFQDKQNNVPLGMFWSVGFGFRWFSPIGPLRFEWGIPLNKRPTDQPVDFEFTIGNFF